MAKTMGDWRKGLKKSARATFKTTRIKGNPSMVSASTFMADRARKKAAMATKVASAGLLGVANRAETAVAKTPKKASEMIEARKRDDAEMKRRVSQAGLLGMINRNEPTSAYTSTNLKSLEGTRRGFSRFKRGNI